MKGKELLKQLQNALANNNKSFHSLYPSLHIELLFQPSRSTELENKDAEDDALLGIIQMSLRPIPRQRLNYYQVKISGVPGTSVKLTLNLNGKSCSLINTADSSTGQIEIEGIAEKTVNLPANGYANLLLRSEIELNNDNVLVFLTLTNTIGDSSKLPDNFGDFFELTDKVLKTKKSLSAIKQDSESKFNEFKKKFAEALKDSENDPAIAEIIVEPLQGFPVTDPLSTYFTVSPESTPPADELLWQRFKKYMQSLNSTSTDSAEIKKITPSAIDEIEHILTWR